MTEYRRKGIIKASQLKTMFFKGNSAEGLRLCKKQNNFVVSCLRNKQTKQCQNNLNLKKVTDNKTFWKTIKPFLSDKGTNINKIFLVYKDEVTSNHKELCNTFSNFFQQAVQTQ